MGQPAIEEQMVSSRSIKSFYEEQLKWEFRKSKSTNPDTSPPVAAEVNVFTELDPNLESGLQAIAKMISTVPLSRWWQEHPVNRKTW